jgi:hypothetical protein
LDKYPSGLQSVDVEQRASAGGPGPKTGPPDARSRF